MTTIAPLWITEFDVVNLLSLVDAIDTLEKGLALEAAGAARNMIKTHVSCGAGSTLHALGASFQGAAIAGTKTWVHAPKGATPLLIIWNSETGGLRAIIEAFALGQLRTAVISAVATRWMSRPDASTMALIGTGKQALAQVAGVQAVRPLRQVRVYSPTPERRHTFVGELARQNFGFDVFEASSAREATSGSDIITLATRAREPFLEGSMVDTGAHINAIGAITPERQEFTQDVFDRADLIVADEPQALRQLSREFMDRFSRPDASWSVVESLSSRVAARRQRPSGCRLSLFKAMGMGIADVALGAEILSRAVTASAGRPLDPPVHVRLRLHEVSQEEAQ